MTTLKNRIDKLVTTNNQLTAEIERLVKWSLLNLAQSDAGGEGLEMEMDKFRIIVSLEGATVNGSAKKDSARWGHFTRNSVWTASDGTKYNQICVNPFVLDSMDAGQFFEVCYHEAVHAYCQYIGHDGTDKPTDCSANGRHTKVFARFAEIGGVLEAVPVSSHYGHITKLTPKGEKLVKKLKVLTPKISRDLNPKVKAMPKRMTLQCDQCGLSCQLTHGQYLTNLIKVIDPFKAGNTGGSRTSDDERFLLNHLWDISCNRADESIKLSDFDHGSRILMDWVMEYQILNCMVCDHGIRPDYDKLFEQWWG
mgnify:CR=1 FL=1